jgi:hypothetical protein
MIFPKKRKINSVKNYMYMGFKMLGRLRYIELNRLILSQVLCGLKFLLRKHKPPGINADRSDPSKK